jgi:hypothetical protein
MPGWLHSIQGVLGQGNGLLLAGAVLTAVGLLVGIRTLSFFLSGGTRLQNSARRRRMSPTGLLVRLLAVAAFVFFSTSILLAGLALRTYTAFTQEELAGTLECLQRDPVGRVMIVRFTPVIQGRAGRPQTFTLYGDQWEIAAHIVKWTPRTIQLGIRTAYRLTQIKGSYQEVSDENQRPHQAFALTPGRDWMWWLLSRYGHYLPFIEAVYGNSVSNPALPGDRFEVLVTTSGLSTKRK